MESEFSRYVARWEEIAQSQGYILDESSMRIPRYAFSDHDKDAEAREDDLAKIFIFHHINLVYEPLQAKRNGITIVTPQVSICTPDPTYAKREAKIFLDMLLTGVRSIRSAIACLDNLRECDAALIGSGYESSFMAPEFSAQPLRLKYTAPVRSEQDITYLMRTFREAVQVTGQ